MFAVVIRHQPTELKDYLGVRTFLSRWIERCLGCVSKVGRYRLMLFLPGWLSCFNIIISYEKSRNFNLFLSIIFHLLGCIVGGGQQRVTMKYTYRLSFYLKFPKVFCLPFQEYSRDVKMTARLYTSLQRTGTYCVCILCAYE